MIVPDLNACHCITCTFTFHIPLKWVLHAKQQYIIQTLKVEMSLYLLVLVAPVAVSASLCPYARAGCRNQIYRTTQDTGINGGTKLPWEQHFPSAYLSAHAEIRQAMRLIFGSYNDLISSRWISVKIAVIFIYSSLSMKILSGEKLAMLGP